MATFTLTIELGNEAMQTSTDVERALTRTALALAHDGYEDLSAGDGGRILDDNGNRVGQWSVTE